jgi:hypothetical protein
LIAHALKAWRSGAVLSNMVAPVCESESFDYPQGSVRPFQQHNRGGA